MWLVRERWSNVAVVQSKKMRAHGTGVTALRSTQHVIV